MTVFLDMSKAFDKVWHEGRLFKLKIYGIGGKLQGLLKDYLHDRKQSVQEKLHRGVVFCQVFRRTLYWDIYSI